MTWTQSEADQRFCERLTEFAREVDAVLTAPAVPFEFAALVSLAYNIGAAAFARSSVLRAHNRGDKAAAARAFALWNKAGGRVIRGLVTRRAKEAALYVSEPRNATPPEGQNPDADVSCEKPLSKSPTVMSGVTSIATGGLALASQASPQVGQIAKNLGVSPILVIAVAAIAVGVVVIVRRYLQRKRGQA
jgi:lysozyme